MTFNIDADPRNADWMRQRWTLPPYKSKAFHQALKEQKITLDEFKRTPMYQFAVEQGLITDDKWTGK